MNSCGVNITSILNRFIDEESIEETIKEYYFSEWYNILEDCKIVFTPKSYIMSFRSLINGEVDELINNLNRKRCFARLDSCSSKPSSPYTSSFEIFNDISKSDRTRLLLRNLNETLIIREWLDNIKCEFRCFIHDGKFRGISFSNDECIDISIWKDLLKKEIQEIIRIIDAITFQTDYNDSVIDLCFYENEDGDIMIGLIEINTPVYLCATSGNFDLDVVLDYEILLGDYKPDIIKYPVIY